MLMAVLLRRLITEEPTRRGARRGEPKVCLGRHVDEGELLSVEGEEASLQYFKVLSLSLH